MLTSSLLFALSALQGVKAAPAVQQVLQAPTEPQRRPLTGKFLQFTDAHPDPFYRVYSSTNEESSCHRNKGPAGYYGAETSDCDSPIALIDAAFDWIRENLRDEIDFVIWTGDSARHDNDPQLPRSTKQVAELNELVVSRFLEALGKDENWDDDDPTNDFVVPIVPTLGNNDILPHNIFTPGPNEWTERYLDIWRGFIPEHQRHQFQRGGWFSVEVIPGKLEVFSLNTLYFFASNSYVDGCARKDSPGYEQFEWLRIQLEMVRARGMKAILIGHVAPARTDSKTSWYETCWQKYTLWTHQYRDVIVTGLYGHMNIDHFMLQDWKDVKKHVRNGKQYDDDDMVTLFEADDEMTVQSAQDYLVSLRDKFAKVPKVEAQDPVGANARKPTWDDVGGEFGERYSVTLVSPSIVPNYFPTLRIFSYNITGLDDTPAPSRKLELRSNEDDDYDHDDDDEDEDEDLNPTGKKGKKDKKDKKKKDKKKKKKKPKARKFKVPTGPAKTSPPGPAYSPQTLSLLSFTQLFANITYLNNDYINVTEEDVNSDKWKPGKHNGKKPPNKHQPTPKNLTFTLEYDTAEDSVYSFPDLTVKYWLNLATSIAESQHHKKKSHQVPWMTFVKRAFVGTFTGDELAEQFESN